MQFYKLTNLDIDILLFGLILVCLQHKLVNAISVIAATINQLKAFIDLPIVVRSQQECIKDWQLAILQHYPIIMRALTEIRNSDPLNYLAHFSSIMEFFLGCRPLYTSCFSKVVPCTVCNSLKQHVRP